MHAAQHLRCRISNRAALRGIGRDVTFLTTAESFSVRSTTVGSSGCTASVATNRTMVACARHSDTTTCVGDSLAGKRVSVRASQKEESRIGRPQAVAVAAQTSLASA
jgi:hypothetical protein